MSKILTDELIEQRLKDHGISMYDGDEKALDKLQEKYEFKLTDNWNETPCYSIYTETTADGYEVFIATYDDRNISVNEHIHYYDNNLSTELEDAIRSSGGYCNIYVAEDFTDEYWYSDMFSEIYQSICEIQEQEIKDILIDEGYEEQPV